MTPKHRPLRYVLTATGDADHDVTHALAVAEAGGDIIAVIRSTAQSLLDYVPEDEESRHAGSGGTFATQANMQQMRDALDDWSREHERYVWLSNFCSGLCMPEIAAIGAIVGLDNMVNDALYGILYRDINMQRTLVDQYFSRMVNGWAGMVINTGEDNYLRTADGMEAAHTVTASQFINYYLAKASGLADWQIGIGHAFEIDPLISDSWLYEIAHAQLARQLFPDCPVKYMPPTRHMTGNLYATHAADTLFNLVSVLTGQGIETIGVPTEGIHTPHIHDRVYALQCVDYVARAAENASREFQVCPDGVVASRASAVLSAAHTLLLHIADIGLFAAIEEGTFGDQKRDRTGGKGLDGVIDKASDYYNPVEEMLHELA